MVTNIKAIIERASNKAMVNISMQMAQFTKEICGRMRGAVMALSNLQMNGDVYKGYWLNGRRHFKGETKLVDGTLHSGLYNRGIMEGFGHFRFKDGSTF